MKEAQLLLTRIKRLPTQHPVYKMPGHKSKIVVMTAIAELDMLNVQGEFRKAVELVPYFENECREFDKNNTQRMRFEFWLKCSLATFCAGDYKRSWSYLNKITMHRYEHYDREWVNFVQLFYLILHFEMGNKEHVYYTLRSTVRKMQKHGSIPLLEETILNFIKANVFRGKRLAHVFPESRLIALLIPIYKENDPTQLCSYFNFLVWAESRLRGTAMQKILVEYRRSKDKNIPLNRYQPQQTSLTECV